MPDSASFLPPIPAPPHDPTFWLLNGRVGWRIASFPGGTMGLTDLEIEPGTSSVTLARLPDSGRLLLEPGGSFGGLTLPANVAMTLEGSLYLLDRRTATLKKFDPCECRFFVVPCFGGIGAEARQLNADHRGIGFCGGNLYVCDTGNHRLGVFTLKGFALRGFWSPPPSAPLSNLWEPGAVAFDGRGRVYVTDGANGCIHRFHPTGIWETCLAGFGHVLGLTIDCRNRLIVAVEGETQARITDTDGKPLGSAARPDALGAVFPPLPFTVDAAGNLHLAPLCESAKETTGVFDLNGEPLTNVPPENGPAYAREGTFLTEALDSDLFRCQWHRVVIGGRVPAGASLRVETFTAEAEYPSDFVRDLPDSSWETRLTVQGMEGGAWDGLIRSEGGRYLWLRLTLRGNGAVTPAVESLRIEYPRISLRRYLPAVFGFEPTSADFTDRFLGIFDTIQRSIETEVDQIARFFDPMATPAVPAQRGGQDFLTWLAGWIGLTLDRHWPEAKRREWVKQAACLFTLRGTHEGLRRALLLYLEMEAERNCCRPCDQPRTLCRPTPENCAPQESLPCAWQPPPLILEHYLLRRWLFLGAGRLGDEAELWGRSIVNRSQLDINAQAERTQLISTPDPYRDPFHHYAHRYTVFVPACYGQSEQGRKGLNNLLKSESPAHTLYHIEYVEPRFRIGVQSMIGFDSVVGRYPEGVTLNTTTLGSASVLGAGPAHQGAPTLAVGRESQIGFTTKLDG